MPVKFAIKSKNGNTLIDDTWRTLSLTSVRSFAQAQNVIISRQNAYSVLALSCETEGAMFLGAYNTNNYSGKNLNGYTIRGNLTIYEFADTDIEYHPNGLNIRNETTGVLIFSSKVKPLRVVHHQSGTINNISSEQTLYEAYLDPSRRYAVVLGNMPFWFNINRGNITILGLTFTTRSDGYVKVAHKRHSFSTPVKAVSGTFNISGFYSFQIIDVTYY